MADLEANDVPPSDELQSGNGTTARTNISYEVNYQPREETPPIVCGFKDHFTLPVESSTIRYRGAKGAARVIQGGDSQYVLEETIQDDGEHNVSIRRIHDTSEGAKFLRMLYAIVTAFWTGFLFVFCLQVLLFLFLDLAIEVGSTSIQSDINWFALFGVIFSFFPFVHGLSGALVIAGSYILDTLRGHPLIRNFAFRQMSSVTVEWIFFGFFLLFPTLIGCFTLLAQSSQWWEITSLVWFFSVTAFYVIFAGNVVWYEIRACWEVTKNRYHDDDDTFLHLVIRSILLRQMSTYSGRKSLSYISVGAFEDAEFTDSLRARSLAIPGTEVENIGWRSGATQWEIWKKWGLYEHLEEPERVYTIDDARDVRPYLTSYTWNLEKVFCRPKNSRYIAIVKGPGAVTRAQMRSSMICSFLGSGLMLLLVLSVLVSLSLGAVFTCFGLAASVVMFYPTFKATFRLYRATAHLSLVRTKAKERSGDATVEATDGAPKEQADDKEDEDADEQVALGEEESEGVFYVSEKYRITRATERMCWLMFGIEAAVFFVWPLAALFAVNNWTLAILFVIVAGISGMRYYVSAAVVLKETGHLNLVGGHDEHTRWKNQSRLNEIVGNITVGRSQGAWQAVLGAFGFIALALVLGAIGHETETNADEVEMGLTYLPATQFRYNQADSLRYPTCTMTNDLAGSPLTTMADFTFLAGLAYSGNSVTETAISEWFGQNVSILETDTLEQYRSDNGVSSAVHFKLFSFPSADNFAIVSIRGTQNAWDALTDTQLWSPAALMQVLREMLPFGQIWTPIIDTLIQIISTVESESIERVSFYKDTVRFVDFLKDQPETYGGVAVTGHSLGGGLSIITGAITGVPAVALSGPNAMLSRRSFDPQVSREALDQYTFNIIPERDVVPMIDDVAQNYQSIRCEAGLTDFIGCHGAVRSLCEVMFTCGNNERPIPCECVTEYGYAEPEAIGGVSFAEACAGPISAAT